MVIAIIAVLVSILVPSLRRAHDLARDTLCMTNLKALGRGVFWFAQDHNGYVPASNTFPHPEGIGRYIWGPYAKVFDDPDAYGYTRYTGQGRAYEDLPKGIAHCPFNVCPRVRYPEGAPSNIQPYGPPGNSRYLHYGEGMWMTYYLGFKSPAERKCMRDFPDLARFFEWSGCCDPATDGSNWGTRRFYGVNRIETSGGIIIDPDEFTLIADTYVYWYKRPWIARHTDGRMNVAFLDLHVQSIQATEPYQMDPYGVRVLYRN